MVNTGKGWMVNEKGRFYIPPNCKRKKDFVIYELVTRQMFKGQKQNNELFLFKNLKPNNRGSILMNI